MNVKSASMIEITYFSFIPAAIFEKKSWIHSDKCLRDLEIYIKMCLKDIHAGSFL